MAFSACNLNERQRTALVGGFTPSQKDPLEEEMETHLGILAWEIPWTEEPGGLQFRGSQRVGQD